MFFIRRDDRDRLDDIGIGISTDSHWLLLRAEKMDDEGRWWFRWGSINGYFNTKKLYIKAEWDPL